jgi:CheY-like chemotaxis protein
MNLTKYHALLISDKPAAQNLMNIFLKEAGIASFSTAQSQREAVTIASKELPHVIVCYEDLPDASTIQVIEALRKVPLLDKALVFVLRNSTQNEIIHLMKLKVSALVSKDTNPNVFIEKIKQKLTFMHGLSPFSIRGEEIVGGSQVTVKVVTKILGRHEGHVVCSSQIEPRPGTMLNVMPSPDKCDPFAVKVTGTSLTARAGAGHENLLNINEIVGKGRQWLQENTPTLSSGSQGAPKKLLVFDTKVDRIETLSKAISIHNIQTDCVPNFSDLISKYKTSPETYGAILFLDPPDTTASAPWEKLKQTLPQDNKPIELIATLNARAPAVENVVWLQKPFALNRIVESFKAAVASQHKPLDAQAPSSSQIPAQFIVQAKITALDEGGGILQVPFVPDTGTDLELDNPFLNHTPLFKKVRVVQAERSEHNPKMSYIRFQVIDAGMTKEKLYTLLLKIVADSKGVGVGAMPFPTAPKPTPTTPRVTSLTAAAAQTNVAKPLWSTQKEAPMPKFNVNTPPKKA